MALAGNQQLDLRQLQPLIDHLHGFLHAESIAGQPGIRMDAKKC
jgi:hypothetical protein